MFRFISHLLGKPYEECKGCETLKQQLEIVNIEKKQLLETVIGFVQPKAVEAPVRELEPITPKSMIWSRRREILEEKERNEARKLRADVNLGKSDDEIAKLEKQLGIKEELEEAPAK